MNQQDIKDRILKSIAELLKRDPELLTSDGNERSISHKLAEYVAKQFPKHHVDCEYNRIGLLDDPKVLKFRRRKTKRAVNPIADTNEHSIYPDIIIHRRRTKENLAVIEIKKSTNREAPDNDHAKLKAFTRSNDDYSYILGLFLLLTTGKEFKDLEKCPVTGTWFINGEKQDFTLQPDAYLRHEVQRGLRQLDVGESSDFNAEKIIAEERRRLRCKIK